ncbi:hypothetical protein [Pseudonocardia sp. TRM90224]|uniref:hypothetical protein n=1 Tax=Pseudonocardia sp. TRM90224 TaxID=2812678 RepID=UPI001E2F380D|nr:hypothetical protein [Pseudonocardia sp. TRM90224]
MIATAVWFVVLAAAVPLVVMFGAIAMERLQSTVVDRPGKGEPARDAQPAVRDSV